LVEEGASETEINFELARPFWTPAHLKDMAGFRDIELTADVSRRLLRAESSAIEEAYRTMAGAVMGLAVRILQDRGLAEEVVQDTFVELVEKAGQINSADAIVGWVRKVAVNHCLMRLRSPWHARRDAAEPEMHVADHRTNTERQEGLAVVEAALAELSASARTVVWLHDVEGYTHREIGALMGKTPSFSKSQLARAYETLLEWQRVSVDPVRGGRRTESKPEVQAAESNGKARLDTIGSPCAS
jgi:RNA polymerase sigma-70 factor (ECF subfamily)